MTKSFSNEKKHHRQTMMIIMEWQSKKKFFLSDYMEETHQLCGCGGDGRQSHIHTQHVAKHLLPNAFYILRIFSNQLLIHHFYFLQNKFCQIQPTNHLHNNFHCIWWIYLSPYCPILFIAFFLIILVCLFACLIAYFWHFVCCCCCCCCCISIFWTKKIFY